ncbi:MAG: bifunctional phosphoserine phosphatase/homoserine phosphotransferase ThrH [Oligosphaeraceae bacterium]|nr:bifunctional phosphoserine phosphatase/homoserine phosphotransferase ThrH [Oligosphaeraceae bacterium]
MKFLVMDLEGVLVPEVWIAFAEKTGIKELRLTTRDIADYDQLMRHRLRVLKENSLKLADIQEVIAGMEPLPGANEYLQWLRQKCQFAILSDTFYEFAAPLMRKLHHPTLLCNSLVCDDQDNIIDYKMRQLDGKRHAVLALKQLNYEVMAMGDSFNDIAMLREAELGILFRPSELVIKQYPEFQVCTEYQQVMEIIEKEISGNN